MDLDYDVLTKFLIIGDSGVGKSCLMQRYAGETFLEDSLSTIGVDFKILSKEIIHKKFPGKNLSVKIQLWDTAGQDRFRAITETYFRGSHGVLIVFDLTNEDSFTNVRKWLDLVNEHIEEDDDVQEGTKNTKKTNGFSLPVILVGNKSDLKLRRMVSQEDAMKLTKEFSIPLYIETSAKDNSNVDQVFNRLIYKAIDGQNFLWNEVKKDDQRQQIGNMIVPKSLTKEQRRKDMNWFQKMCHIL